MRVVLARKRRGSGSRKLTGLRLHRLAGLRLHARLAGLRLHARLAGLGLHTRLARLTPLGLGRRRRCRGRIVLFAGARENEHGNDTHEQS